MTAAPPTVLQCARVDNLPDARGRANLANVLDGTLTAPCFRCRAKVWVSRVARDLIANGRLRPVCDVCEPAAPVSLGHLDGGNT